MDWNRGVLLLAQTVMFVTFAVLVGLGHNGVTEQAMLVISGSLAGTGLYTTLRAKKGPSVD